MDDADFKVTPKVSVCLITYNHEQFVRDAVNSVLAQQRSFDFELVIGEDHSTDGTRAIVREFRNRFPHEIRLVLHDTRRGLLDNFYETFHACQGEYIALIDGDDYWTDPAKLHKQVALLDAHPECSICFHDASVLRSGPRVSDERYTGPDQKEISTIEDLFAGNFIATSSAMIRRHAIDHLPNWFSTSPWEDWPLFMLYAEHGTIIYLQEIMAVYRSHAHGLWSGLSEMTQLETTIAVLLAADDWFERRYHGLIESSVHKHRLRLAELHQIDARDKSVVHGRESGNPASLRRPPTE